MTIEEFRHSNDYRDIMYMIKHVPYDDTLCDVLRSLGYCVTVLPIKNEFLNYVGCLTYNKRRQIQMQITRQIKNKIYAWGVVI